MNTEKGMRLSLCSLHRANSQQLRVALQVKTAWLQGLQGVPGPSEADDNGQVVLHEEFFWEADGGGLKTVQAGDPTPGLKDDALPGKKT